MIIFILHVLISIGHWLPTVLGYNLVFGKGKIFHFGPLGVSVVTSYALFIVLIQTQSFVLGILAGILAATVVSLVFAWLSLRLEPDGMGVMSIAMHLALLNVVLNWTSLTRGALGIPKIPQLPFLKSIEVFAIVTWVLALLFVLFYVWLDRTRFARHLEALAEHEWYAKSLGVNKALIHSIAFVILGMGHVFGGFFAFQYIQFLHPNDFQFPALIFLIMTVVAGRPGNLKGVIVSAFLLVTLKEAIRFVPLSAAILGPARLILFGLILFIAVWWRRDTLFPHQRKI